MKSISPLAVRPHPLRTEFQRSTGKVVPLPRRVTWPLGLMVHTTGGTIVKKAREHGVDPLEYAVAYYERLSSYGPHYVLGWDGTLVQIVDEMVIAYHAAWETKKFDERAIYVNPNHYWRMTVDASAWTQRWPGMLSPTGLTGPVRTPNQAFIGLEMLPLEKADADGLLFTSDQHRRVAELAADIWARHGIRPHKAALVGHEDVCPLSRWDKGGGWDPGALRARPRFSWPLVYAHLGLS